MPSHISLDAIPCNQHDCDKSYYVITILDKHQNLVKTGKYHVDDHEQVSVLNWYCNKNYLYPTKGVRQAMHVMLTGQRNVDHKDQDPTNNCRCNLDTTTNPSKQVHNQRKKKNSTSNNKGVHLNKRNGKWKTTLTFRRKCVSEFYELESHAAYAYQLLSHEYYQDKITLPEPEGFVRFVSKTLVVRQQRQQEDMKYITRKKDQYELKIKVPESPRIIRISDTSLEYLKQERDLILQELETSQRTWILCQPIPESPWLSLVECVCYLTVSNNVDVRVYVDRKYYHRLLLMGNWMINGAGYIVNGVTKRLMHHVVLTDFEHNIPSHPYMTIDHRNHHKFDNRVDNLRWATNSVQSFNKPTRIVRALPRGVTQRHPPHGTYRAKLDVNYRQYSSYYPTMELAAVAYAHMCLQFYQQYPYEDDEQKYTVIPEGWRYDSEQVKLLKTEKIE